MDILAFYARTVDGGHRVAFARYDATTKSITADGVFTSPTEPEPRALAELRDRVVELLRNAPTEIVVRQQSQQHGVSPVSLRAEGVILAACGEAGIDATFVSTNSFQPLAGTKKPKEGSATICQAALGSVPADPDVAQAAAVAIVRGT
jgi:hypothetical protein